MSDIEDYFERLVYGNEENAIWVLIVAAAIWGCLLAITGLLAVQEYLDNRRNAEDQS